MKRTSRYGQSITAIFLMLTTGVTTLLAMPSPAHAGQNPFQDGNIISLQADTGKWFSRCANCQNTVDRNRLRDTITLHVDNPDAGHAKFTVVDMHNGKIALRSHTGKYVARCEGCIHGAAYPNSLTIHVDSPDGGYAQFTPIALNNGKYALQADTGGYVTRCNNCSPGAAYPDTVTMHVRDPNGSYAQWNVHVWNPSPPAVVINGNIVKSVSHANHGSFRQTGNGQWTEFNSSGQATFYFVEQLRNERSVYMFDQSRGVNIHLDLQRNKVLYGTNNGPMSDLYDITSVQ